MEEKQSMSKPFKMAVCIVDDPDKIRLLADFTRAEILQLLCEHPMTETQLSKELARLYLTLMFLPNSISS